MRAIVVRDAQGVCINIGPWPADDPDNPMPAGATQAEEDIAILPDGGLRPVAEVAAAPDPAARLAALEVELAALKAQLETAG